MGEIKLFESSNQLNKLLHKTIHSKYHTLVMPAGQNCVNATKLFQIMEKQRLKTHVYSNPMQMLSWKYNILNAIKIIKYH